MNAQELRVHALRRLYERAEAEGYEKYFSLDEIASEVGVCDRMKVLRLGEALEAEGLVTLAATHGGTGAAINMRGAQAVEEFLLFFEAKKDSAAGMHIAKDLGEGVQIFISHSSKDAAIAEQLVDLLRAALNIRPSEIRCTSVDGHRLEVGADTDSRLRRDLIEARLFIGIIFRRPL